MSSPDPSLLNRPLSQPDNEALDQISPSRKLDRDRIHNLEGAVLLERRLNHELERRVQQRDDVVVQDLKLLRELQHESLLDRELRQHLQDRLIDLVELGERTDRAKHKALKDSDIESEKLDFSLGNNGSAKPSAEAPSCERLEYYLLSFEQAFSVLHDVSIFRRHKLLQAELGKCQTEGLRLIKVSQEIMSYINEVGRKLCNANTNSTKESAVRVNELGKRPYWAGDLVGMNECLQKFGHAITTFSEVMRTLEQTSRIARLNNSNSNGNSKADSQNNNNNSMSIGGSSPGPGPSPLDQAVLTSMKATSNRTKQRAKELLGPVAVAAGGASNQQSQTGGYNQQQQPGSTTSMMSQSMQLTSSKRSSPMSPNPNRSNMSIQSQNPKTAKNNPNTINSAINRNTSPSTRTMMMPQLLENNFVPGGRKQKNNQLPRGKVRDLSPSVSAAINTNKQPGITERFQAGNFQYYGESTGSGDTDQQSNGDQIFKESTARHKKTFMEKDVIPGSLNQISANGNNISNNKQLQTTSNSQQNFMYYPNVTNQSNSTINKSQTSPTIPLPTHVTGVGAQPIQSTIITLQDSKDAGPVVLTQRPGSRSVSKESNTSQTANQQTQQGQGRIVRNEKFFNNEFKKREEIMKKLDESKERSSNQKVIEKPDIGLAGSSSSGGKDYGSLYYDLDSDGNIGVTAPKLNQNLNLNLNQSSQNQGIQQPGPGNSTHPKRGSKQPEFRTGREYLFGVPQKDSKPTMWKDQLYHSLRDPGSAPFLTPGSKTVPFNVVHSGSNSVNSVENSVNESSQQNVINDNKDLTSAQQQEQQQQPSDDHHDHDVIHLQPPSSSSSSSSASSSASATTASSATAQPNHSNTIIDSNTATNTQQSSKETAAPGSQIFQASTAPGLDKLMALRPGVPSSPVKPPTGTSESVPPIVSENVTGSTNPVTVQQLQMPNLPGLIGSSMNFSDIVNKNSSNFNTNSESSSTNLSSKEKVILQENGNTNPQTQSQQNQNLNLDEMLSEIDAIAKSGSGTSFSIFSRADGSRKNIQEIRNNHNNSSNVTVNAVVNSDINNNSATVTNNSADTSTNEVDINVNVSASTSFNIQDSQTGANQQSLSAPSSYLNKSTLAFLGKNQSQQQSQEGNCNADGTSSTVQQQQVNEKNHNDTTITSSNISAYEEFLKKFPMPEVPQDPMRKGDVLENLKSQSSYTAASVTAAAVTTAAAAAPVTPSSQNVSISNLHKLRSLNLEKSEMIEKDINSLNQDIDNLLNKSSQTNQNITDNSVTNNDVLNQSIRSQSQNVPGMHNVFTSTVNRNENFNLNDSLSHSQINTINSINPITNSNINQQSKQQSTITPLKNPESIRPDLYNPDNNDSLRRILYGANTGMSLTPGRLSSSSTNHNHVAGKRGLAHVTEKSQVDQQCANNNVSVSVPHTPSMWDRDRDRDRDRLLKTTYVTNNLTSSHMSLSRGSPYVGSRDINTGGIAASATNHGQGSDTNSNTVDRLSMSYQGTQTQYHSTGIDRTIDPLSSSSSGPIGHSPNLNLNLNTKSPLPTRLHGTGGAPPLPPTTPQSNTGSAANRFKQSFLNREKTALFSTKNTVTSHDLGLSPGFTMGLKPLNSNDNSEFIHASHSDKAVHLQRADTGYSITGIALQSQNSSSSLSGYNNYGSSTVPHITVTQADSAPDHLSSSQQAGGPGPVSSAYNKLTDPYQGLITNHNLNLSSLSNTNTPSRHHHSHGKSAGGSDVLSDIGRSIHGSSQVLGGDRVNLLRKY